MKRSLKNLTGYSLEAMDGPKGEVRDFLFDEERWIIRYLEADFGNLFKNKKVLIPGIFLKKPEGDNKHFPVNLTKEDIESCPDLDEKMPVSREYEKELNKHYNIDNYWPYVYTAPAGAAMYFPPRPIKVPSKIINEKDLDTSLRSFKEVEGYYIKAINGKLGHVEDIIIDDNDWQIVYLIVDTSNWQPWSKKVLLPVDWMGEISYVDRKVTINLISEIIKNAPEFYPVHSVEIDYEKALYEFYNNSFGK